MLKKKSQAKSVKLTRTKRSQAAMEFLMTYSWAILLVLIVVGAVVYFGFIDKTFIQKTMKPKCDLGPMITCMDFSVYNAYVVLKVRNDYTEALDLSLIKSGDCEEFNLNDASLKPTEVRTIILGGCNFQDKIVDDVFEFTFNIDYGSSSGASHSGSGLIKAPVSDDHIKELTMASNEIIDVCAKAEILTRETSYNLCTQLATSEPAKFALCCPQQVGERCAANPRPDDCYCC